MAIPAAYPPAQQKLDGSGSGSWSGVGGWKVVLHTTETEGIPGYSNGALAPHVTYNPRTRKWVQHVPFTRPAESLLTYDNDQVIQVEIVCYSARGIADDQPTERIWVGNLTDANLSDLADFFLWVKRFLPILSVWPGKVALSAATANASGFRMTVKQFELFNGILGHQHVPTPNVHWDPGAFPWGRFMGILSDKENVMTPAQEAKLDRVLALLEISDDGVKVPTLEHPLSDSGLTPRQAQLKGAVDAELSTATIAKIVKGVLDGIKALVWRPS